MKAITLKMDVARQLPKAQFLPQRPKQAHRNQDKAGYDQKSGH